MRPGMYIGFLRKRGSLLLVWEIVDSSVDNEALRLDSLVISRSLHWTTMIQLQLSMMDEGIPVDVQRKDEPSLPLRLSLLFLRRRKIQKRCSGSWSIKGGLHGVGSSVVNALSTPVWMFVFIKMERSTTRVPSWTCWPADLEVIGDTDKTGTIVHFTQTQKFYWDNDIWFDKLNKHLFKVAFESRAPSNLYHWQTWRTWAVKRYRTKVGLSFVSTSATKDVIFDTPIYTDDEMDDITVENKRCSTQLVTSNHEFLNNIHTSEDWNTWTRFPYSLNSCY